MISNPLVRYNFRILMFHNWWLLVIPLAASQLIVFWTAVTQRFSPPLPSGIVESISPLLAAFLSAHLLAAEYRSGIGAVLAAKPIDIGKVVLLRLSIVMALVWALGGLSLLAFYFGLEPYPLLPPALALMASSLFLGLFSLTFATLFRHPLAGFGVAALYWACDLPPGPPINSYLSLKSLTFSFPPAGVPLGQPLTDYWWIAKILLLVFAIALYLFHKRLLFTLGSPLTVRRRRRTLFWIGGILCFYLVTGAVSKVAYGYANRSKLFPNDITWFRRQFGPFGPVPVARLFGANFQRYLGGIPSSWRVQSEGDTADSFGDTIQHRQDLDRILQTAPNSIWAPSAAILAAHFGAHNEVPTDEKVKAYYYAADHYPDSPYTPYAMQQIAFLYANSITSDATCEQKAREAYANLIKHYPKGEYNSESYRFLAESARRHSDIAGAARYVQQWIEVAPVYDKFMALMLLADIRREEGKDGEAKKVAKQALQAIAEFNVALRAGPLPLSEQRRVRIEKDASDAEKRARAF